MPVELAHLRDLLMPGLLEISQRYSFQMTDWRGIYGAFETTPAAPHIWIPKLSVPQALVVGAAAAIIKNPVITRRFWTGWVK